ncbi:MAG: hypothetical protein M3256_11360 [Actinomycetota bacterium]|nr:hypothetical protein [Actinomycetota bacterium]
MRTFVFNVATSKVSPPPGPSDDISGAVWRTVVTAWANLIQDDLDRVAPVETTRNAAEASDAAAVGRHLQAARKAAASFGPRAVLRWWSGTHVERAWREIHAAQQAMIGLGDAESLRAGLPELSYALSSALAPVDPRGVRDPRVAQYQSTLTAASRHPETFRPQIRTIKRVIDEAADEAYENLRVLRNAVISLTGILGAVLAVLAVAEVISPGLIPMGPNGGGRADLIIVEVVGGLGGALAVVLPLGARWGSVSSYNPAVAAGALKIVSGAATGLGGVLIIYGGLSGVQVSPSRTALFAYALVFGLGQQAFTRLADRAVTNAIGDAQSRNDPTKPSLGSGGPDLPSMISDAGVLAVDRATLRVLSTEEALGRIVGNIDPPPPSPVAGTSS